MTALRALIFVAVCYVMLWLLVGCGSTIRLDYDGNGGRVGIGITLPDGYSKDRQLERVMLQQNRHASERVAR